MENLSAFFASIYDTAVLFLADDPALRFLQLAVVLFASLLIFLIFFVTRDVLQRTDSFFFMFLSIVLVAVLPIIGFFVYLLIRPSLTLHERAVEKKLIAIESELHALRAMGQEWQGSLDRMTDALEKPVSSKKRSSRKK